MVSYSHPVIVFVVTMIYYTQGIRSSVQYVAQRMRVLGIVLAGAILVRVALVVLFPMQFVNQLDAIPNYYLSTNTTAAGLAAGTLFTAVGPNGFSVGSSSLVNANTNNYVAWAWASSATSGFEMVKYTGNGANRTIAHSLGDTPDFMIVKRTDSTSDWIMYHQGLSSPSTQYLKLNSQSSLVTTDATIWNSTTPTSVNYSLGTNVAVNANAGSYIAYLWAEKAGYSKFGSYTGNGAADGAFVYTGFKPRYIFLGPASGATSKWLVYDTTRQTYNPNGRILSPDFSDAEGDLSIRYIDVLSNGFKIRTSASGVNPSGGIVIYAAFAEYPFKEQHMPNGYSIASSTRFSGSDARLSKTYSTTSSDGKKATLSLWFKPGKFTAYERIWSSTGGYETNWVEPTTGRLFFRFANYDFLTAGSIFRDVSAWIHLTLVFDSTQAVSTDRVKLYIDGVLNNYWATYSTIPLNTSMTLWMQNGGFNRIGCNTADGQECYTGYLADIHSIDGQALAASDFGQFDSNGIWHPSAYSGTYGTNGFHLDFANPADPGNDVSGNNNDFTNNNIATTDNVIDTPTNNFAVANSVNNFGTTLSQGNLLVTAGTGNLVRGSLGVSTGKYYWEGTATAITGTYWTMGLCDERNSVHTLPYDLRTTGCYGNMQAYYKTINGGALTAFDANGYDGATHTHMIAVDLDNDKIWFGLDGVWYDAGNPATNSNGYTISASQDGRTFMPVFGSGSASTLNFGQGGQSGLTYDAASGGYFKYTPPTGFKALSTANMPATSASLIKGKNWFDAVTYTGNGTAQSITSLNFEPGFVWVKNRTSATDHALFGDGTTGTTTVTIPFFMEW